MKLKCFSVIVGLAVSALSSVSGQSLIEGFESPVVGGMSVGVTPDGWGWFDTIGGGSLRTDGVTSTTAHSGNQSLFFTTSSSQGAGYESIYLHGTPATLNLNPEDEVVGSIWVRSDVLEPYSGDCIYVLAMEFHDSTQGGNPFVGQGLIFVNPNQMSSSDWTEFSVTASPTAFSDNLFFVLKSANFSGGAYGSSSGTFYVDDLRAYVVPEPGAAVVTGLGVLMYWVLRGRPSRG